MDVLSEKHFEKHLKIVTGQIIPKHKKEFSNPVSDERLYRCFEIIQNSLLKLPPKQQHLLLEWVETWCDYIDKEATFKPQRLVAYKRGDLVMANFGFNVGSELGGVHYAVVVEKNNNPTNNVVTVVPISSLASGKAVKDLHKSTVYLGEIIPGSGRKSFAMPLQIRTISKLRIIKPKQKEDGKYKATKEQLNQIDEKIKLLFTK